jgi:hypothetical protein
VKVGLEVGDIVGVALGVPVGALVGSIVGGGVGVSVGFFVGSPVGGSVSFFVGRAVGSSVSTGLGFLVGSSVGCLDGGIGVGDMVTKLVALAVGTMARRSEIRVALVALRHCYSHLHFLSLAAERQPALGRAAGTLSAALGVLARPRHFRTASIFRRNVAAAAPSQLRG